MADKSVLIIGAGPTGLVLALWLTKQGVPVRIIDKTAAPGTTSRALAVQGRTLELYQQLDLAEAVTSKGYHVPQVRFWAGGEEKARVPFGQTGSDLTRYPFLEIFPQDEHERLLIERLEALGVRVERSTELLSYTDDGESVSARLRGPDGAGISANAAYIAGCDGARSKVREIMGTGFPGGTYPQTFYVADVAGSGPAFNGDLNVDLDESDFLAVFPLADKGRVRLIGTIREGGNLDLSKLTYDDISNRAIQKLKLEVGKVNWFSVYHLHHRVTEHFRRGRAFVLGDAAHIHTPVGGQGMNTGIGDSINLAWKLAAVLNGSAAASLLDTYEAERRAFALRLVSTTDRVFTLAAAQGHVANLIRTRLAPVALPSILKIESVREWIFRTVSQITLNYRGQALSEGRAGPVRGGDRLPWVKMGVSDNYQSLRHIGWQVHVYGTAAAELKAWCPSRQIPLHVFSWSKAFGDAGLEENALYLLRPDTYVALASSAQSAGALQKYFETAGITPAREMA